jgi:hypothetical protein
VIPREFLQPEELAALTGKRQRAKWRAWLDSIGVRYVCTPNGTPLVYRDRVTPEQAAAPAAMLNLGALDAPRRPTAKS